MTPGEDPPKRPIPQFLAKEDQIQTKQAQVTTTPLGLIGHPQDPCELERAWYDYKVKKREAKRAHKIWLELKKAAKYIDSPSVSDDDDDEKK